jgi:putative intracellular protease/amidase
MSWDTLNLIDSSDAASGGGPPRFAGRIGADEVEAGCCAELDVVMIIGGWAGRYRLRSRIHVVSVLVRLLTPLISFLAEAQDTHARTHWLWHQLAKLRKSGPSP